ncbi:MAG: hypothetical protein ACK5AZ_19760 [Bryobacteraceae bacterium]
MQTIFGMFADYDEAKAAVEELLERRFRLEEMNAIVQTWVWKSNTEADLNLAAVEVTPHLGPKVLHGLDRLIAGKQPRRFADAGEIYSAGEFATIVANTAESSRQPDALRAALIDFGVPERVASDYIDRLTRGGILIWLRCEDKRAAEAASVLQSRKGERVGSYMP